MAKKDQGGPGSVLGRGAPIAHGWRAERRPAGAGPVAAGCHALERHVIGETIDGFLSHIALERGLSPHTVEAYAGDLADFTCYLDTRSRALEQVATADVVGFMGYLAHKGLSVTSRARKLTAVRSFFRFLVGEGIVGEDPCVAVEVPPRPRRLPRTLTPDEVERLLAAPDASTPLGLRDKALMELLYSCGLRVSEAVGLGSVDLDLGEGMVRVRGKGDKERMVPVGRRAIGLLTRYLDEARPRILPRPGSTRVFLNGRGRSLSRVGCFKLVKRYALVAGITRKVSPHTLRHSFASHMLESGADIRIVQELLGHASVSTTEIYGHLTRDKVFADYRRYHPRA